MLAPPRRFVAVERVLKDNWKAGRMTFVLPGGRKVVFSGAEGGPSATLVVNDYHFIDRVLSRGLVGFGEGFMAGEWDTPDLSALLLAFSRNLDRIGKVVRGTGIARFMLGLMHRLHANTRRGARRNIEAHYDLGNDFYSLWLDETMTYSAARFDAGATTLAEAPIGSVCFWGLHAAFHAGLSGFDHYVIASSYDDAPAPQTVRVDVNDLRHEAPDLVLAPPV